jgi:excisionase family DNA binding protein
MKQSARAIEKRFLTITEASVETSLSEKFLRRDIARGALKHHRFGRAIRIAREDLEAYIKLRRS